MAPKSISQGTLKTDFGEPKRTKSAPNVIEYTWFLVNGGLSQKSCHFSVMKKYCGFIILKRSVRVVIRRTQSNIFASSKNGRDFFHGNIMRSKWLLSLNQLTSHIYFSNCWLVI